MSVINQVLNQLEQRGAPPVPEQTLVRAVPPHRKWNFVLVLALAAALLAGFAVWWRLPVPATGMQQPVVAAVPVAAPRPVVAREAPEVFPPASRFSIEMAAPAVPPAPPEAKGATGPVPTATPEAKGGVTSATPAQVPGATAKAVSMQPRATGGQAVAQEPVAELPTKRISPAQLADAEFHRAATLTQQGRVADAIEGYETALRLNAGHRDARQALAALLLEGKRNADAERVLQEGLAVQPEQSGFAMLLARLQVERGALDEAVRTLEKFRPHAASQADYHAFLAALLQRQNRHGEAVDHYRTALQQVPDNGIWLMGHGISLQAMRRNAEAREAFGRALEVNGLTPELQAFVRQKLKEL